MNFVLDASVAASWLLADGLPKDVAYATGVLRAMQSAEATAHVPVIWSAEVANLVRRVQSKSWVSRARCGDFVTLLNNLGIATDLESCGLALTDTLQLALKYNLSAYDASYLELSMRRAVPLATLDQDLIKAARKAGIKRMANRAYE